MGGQDKDRGLAVILEKLRRKVSKYCDGKYPTKLDVRAYENARPLYNNNCHLNADACVRRGEAVASVECLVVTEGWAVLHYVSLASDMTCFDVTLGPLYLGSDYRLIEVIRDFPDNDPSERLESKKREICLAAGVPSWMLKIYKPGDIM